MDTFIRGHKTAVHDRREGQHPALFQKDRTILHILQQVVKKAVESRSGQQEQEREKHHPLSDIGRTGVHQFPEKAGDEK